MRLLKLLSVLLDYPREELWTHAVELRAAAMDPALNRARRQQLLAFVDELMDLPPMDAQERWLFLFDRGRAMSLLLFEHIHGESRDRGQAMVDLVESYHRRGFVLESRELPDYLPVLLEFLSEQSPEKVADWLRHTCHILELLAARAAGRGSVYATLFEILVEVGTGCVDLELMRTRVAREACDDTPEAIDRVWEEEVIRFGADPPSGGCASSHHSRGRIPVDESRSPR